MPSARTEQPGSPLPPVTPPASPRAAPAAVDIEALRHPTENSRFALALIASSAIVAIGVGVLVYIGQVTEILAVVLAILAVFALLWFSLQLWRVRLLADGVQVSSASLPEVQDVMDVVRTRLDYSGRVDVFVVDKVSRVLGPDAAPITLTSFFGVRVIVAEGSALGDLRNERQRQQLVFLLATCVGALKARHTRWSPYLMALELSGLPKLVFLFVYPWYRATTYTGDRIAYACCGDLDVSLEAVYRVLVGKETAPHLRPAGLLQQALVVRRKVILRLSQLLRRVPHATNRYLDLLSFAGSYDAAVFDAFRASVGDAPAEVDDVFAQLRRRRPSSVAVPLGVLLAAVVLLAGVVVGLALPNPNNETIVDPPPPGPTPTTPGPTNPTPTPTPTPTGPTATQVLLTHLPADLQNSKCEEGTPDPAKGEVAVAANCNATGAAGPNTVDYTAYSSRQAMQNAFDARVRAESGKRCSTGPAVWTKSNGNVGGPIACYAFDVDSIVMWGDNDTAILGYARDPVRPVNEILAWWRTHPIR